MKNYVVIFFALIFISKAFAQELDEASNVDRPNFLIVVADDMGWSDIGALGGEIRTPNLDALAQTGTLMTDYYVAPTCAPTRAMLMTGVDNHLAGLGVMAGIRAPNQVGKNYEGKLHNEVVTMAEALNANGYQTFMSGKWHLGEGEQDPHARGFQKTFSMLNGGVSHFGDQKDMNPVELAKYTENGQEVRLSKDFYSSISYADKILEHLETRDKSTPFLAYLAFTAPHDPLGVPDEWLDRYAGAYEQGPQATRRARAEKQKAQGLIPENTKLWQYPRFPSWFPNHLPPWNDRSADRKVRDSRPMEIYAAMVELLDQQFGRVIAKLKEQGDLDNTYVIFFSDNGASSPGPFVYPGVTDEWFSENWSDAHETRGKPGNFGVQGPEWSSVSVTPWKLYKNSVSEGGIRSPLIISGPLVPEGQRRSSLAHVTDIVSTIYDIVDIQPQTESLYEGKLMPQGTSLMPVLTGDQNEVRSMFGVELFGNRGLRKGEWKISFTQKPQGSEQWELYRLTDDPGEVNNLAEEFPEKMAELRAEYDKYVEQNGVIHPNPRSLNAGLREVFMTECDWWCKLRFEIIDLLPRR